MKKIGLFITIFMSIMNPVCAQSGERSIAQIDNTVNVLAKDIHIKLVEFRATKAAVSQQYTFMGNTPPFVSYWVNQLTGELTNIPNKPYLLLSDGLAGADYRIAGEIVEVGDIIRVYTRLIRQDNRAIMASFHSDLERNATTTSLLASGRNGSMYVPLDDYEPDSWDDPVSFEIGEDENVTAVARTISGNDDVDFFLLLPNQDGRLVMETTGGTDTYIEFYEADTKRLLAEDDDGGQGGNARIVSNVESGKRYIAKIRGYGGEATGNYAFRAYYRPPREEVGSNWENPIHYALGTNRNTSEVNRTLDRDDADFFLLLPNTDGSLVMETTGDTDTYMELFDANTKRLLAEDDDSGSEANARISHDIETGKRYLLKIQGYGGSPGSYGFRAFIQR